MSPDAVFALLLQASDKLAPDTSTFRIICGVLIVILVVIIFLRRKGKKKTGEDEF